MDIDVPLVTRLIAEQFPHWAHLAIRPVEQGGCDNRTFRLGDEMSVRLPSAGCYATQAEKEQTWLPKLAPGLPLAVPVPVAMGVPADGYPWNWSIYQWLEGEPAALENINDPNAFAVSLGRFLVDLQRIDSAQGPLPGPHNFFRGGPLEVYHDETRAAVASLRGRIDETSAIRVWNAALSSQWQNTPVWIHGDVSPANLLVRDGKLSAVIDFGCSGTGDPACDLTIAWTFFSGESRRVFREAVPLDEATWWRARGWALWKALITFAELIDTDLPQAAHARYVIREVLDDHS